MSALEQPSNPGPPRPNPNANGFCSRRRPQLAATMGRYLTQLATFLAPRSVEGADNALRQFARWMIAETDVTVVAGITRTHIEDYKVFLAGHPGARTRTWLRTPNVSGYA